MLALGTIGTSSITANFIHQATQTGRYTLKGVYSRSIDKGQSFVQTLKIEYPEKVTIFNDFELLIQNEEIDILYIASPNSLHFDQAMRAIQAKKHIIVEKPIVQSYEELQRLYQLAEEQGVYVFEAARHIHEQNFKTVTQFIEENKTAVNGASLTYAKYSSRYDAVLSGEEPNIFSPTFKGGALNDLGVYLVYAAVVWFGMPKRVSYQYQSIRTGVDGAGIAILYYENFNVSLHTSKIYPSEHTSEIYLGKQVLELSGVEGIRGVNNTASETSKVGLELQEKPKLLLYPEAIAFAEIIEERMDERYHQLKDYSNNVMRVMDQLRAFLK